MIRVYLQKFWLTLSNVVLVFSEHETKNVTTMSTVLAKLRLEYQSLVFEYP